MKAEAPEKEGAVCWASQGTPRAAGCGGDVLSVPQVLRVPLAQCGGLLTSLVPITF